VKYRKKPIVIDAVPYAPEEHIEDGIDTFVVGTVTDPALLRTIESFYGKEVANDPTAQVQVPYIQTLEGKLYISQTDFILTGVKGERYPCKKDIFEATYEPVK
jgi:hypothetical protein